ncbi:MAG TPA: M1 family metallopeptidase [Chitinophagaceae bacterium]|nr:M1 family metallopeptidase [Chitinophagaceae bacterium]
MKKLLYLLTILSLLQTTLHGQTKRWQQEVNYTIDVRLNDTLFTLDGFEKIQYINNSPDTLQYIWFHIWPNAFKNDKTAFSDQLLGNGRTDFYFSDNNQRGYINRLDFRIGNTSAKTEDHPQHIDIIKVILPTPLAPGRKVEITTPFHVQLPHNFSRGGHVGQSFQVTQWYPKPAVYDHKGWHPMPYLDQGEFYSEFGSFDVRITVPVGYVVAATGELQHEERNEPSKTLRYTQPKVHDFAWFADKDFIVKQDTLQLPSGRIIKAFSYYTAGEEKIYANSVQMIKDAVRFRSRVLGEYPYNVVSVVQGPAGSGGGMEYPTITLLRGITQEKELDLIIEHELGHNWFYGILASNERTHPWMDEGMNTYYDMRYLQEKYGNTSLLNGAFGITTKKLPGDEMKFALDIVTNVKKHQPVNTTSEAFTGYNYNLIAYAGAAEWLQQLESIMGRQRLDSAMKVYYDQWKFRHPYPEDFIDIMQSAGGSAVADHAKRLNIKDTGYMPGKRQPKLTGFFNFKDYQKYHYISLLPAVGYNKYDQFMIGLGIHNYTLPQNRLEFALFPLYATGSRQFNGIGRISYSWFPDKKIYKVQAGISGARFSGQGDADSTGSKVFGGFYKLAPFVKIVFNKKDPRNLHTWWIDARTYFIGEKYLDYVMALSDSNFYATEGSYQTRYVNQLTLGTDNYRALYPYDAQLQLQQGKEFYRLNFTGNYFFNYAKGGGINLRLFAAKFGYINKGAGVNELSTGRFQPKLTAINGEEDFTYSNYFIGRNEFEGFASQQVMMRDGGLKLRMDKFQGYEGRSDEWVAAMNFTTTLPDKLFPVKIPLKVFLDVGTFAEAWQRGALTSRFVYVGGLQLSLFKNVLNIYAPIVFSSELRNNLKTLPEDYKFFRRLSFSIDLHTLSSRKLLGQAGFL